MGRGVFQYKTPGRLGCRRSPGPHQAASHAGTENFKFKVCASERFWEWAPSALESMSVLPTGSSCTGPEGPSCQSLAILVWAAQLWETRDLELGSVWRIQVSRVVSWGFMASALFQVLTNKDGGQG